MAVVVVMMVVVIVTLKTFSNRYLFAYWCIIQPNGCHSL